MARYLLTVTDSDAARLERWLGGRIEIVPSHGPLGEVAGQRAVIAGLDAITDEEYEFIAPRLRTSGPLYHAGGPSAVLAVKTSRGLGTALLAVGLGLFALIYATEALHALVVHYWFSAAICVPTSVVYGWAFLQAFGRLGSPGGRGPIR